MSVKIYSKLPEHFNEKGRCYSRTKRSDGGFWFKEYPQVRVLSITDPRVPFWRMSKEGGRNKVVLVLAKKGEGATLDLSWLEDNDPTAKEVAKNLSRLWVVGGSMAIRRKLRNMGAANFSKNGPQDIKSLVEWAGTL